jgi:hypothetical protein
VRTCVVDLLFIGTTYPAVTGRGGCGFAATTARNLISPPSFFPPAALAANKSDQQMIDVDDSWMPLAGRQKKRNKKPE